VDHFGRKSRDCVVDVCWPDSPPVFCGQKRLEPPVIVAARHGILLTVVSTNVNYALSKSMAPYRAKVDRPGQETRYEESEGYPDSRRWKSSYNDLTLAGLVPVLAGWSATPLLQERRSHPLLVQGPHKRCHSRILGLDAGHSASPLQSSSIFSVP
jgi:hypothetical protein